MSALNKWDWENQSKFDEMLKRSFSIHIRNSYGGGNKSNTSRKFDKNKLAVKEMNLDLYCQVHPNNLVAKRHLDKVQKKLKGEGI